MAVNKYPFVRNLLGLTEPLQMFGKFQAGASQAVFSGEILELTAGGSTQWVPMDSDFNMNSDVAIAACEIKNGDLAGYYPIWVPRPGDVWVYALAAATNPALGAALYWSASQTLTTSAGTNIIGRVADTSHYPEQGFGSVGTVTDAGTTIKTISSVQTIFVHSASYYSLFDDFAE